MMIDDQWEFRWIDFIYGGLIALILFYIMINVIDYVSRI